MHLHLVLLLLPMLFGFIQGEEGHCPNAFIHPCKCKSSVDGACIITCSSIIQNCIERIADIPNLCSGHVHLVLDESVLNNDIPARLWKTLLSSKTVDISIKRTVVKGIGRAQEDIPKVYTPGPAVIKISHSVLKNFDWKVLRNFYSEEELTLVIEHSTLGALSPDFSLIADGQVHRVTIDRTALRTVPPNVFAPFEDLISLSFTNNYLPSLSRSFVAKPAKQLKSLALNGNSLRTLPGDMFSDMPLLEVVNMRNNEFTTLPQDVFQNANSYHLLRFDFSHNPWECDCRLSWILSNTKHIVDMGRTCPKC